MHYYLRRAVLAVILLAALLATACGTSGKSEDPIKSAGVLRVGTEGVYSPFSYHDPKTGELVGYDVDVAKAVGEKLGVKVEFVETPWDSIFAALEADRFDVVANQVTINPERQGKYDLSQPYTVGEGVIVTRANDNSIKSLADIKGKTAAENATSNWSEVARKAGAKVEAVEGFTQAITLLNQGRVDVVVNDSIAVYAYLAETGDTSVKIAGTVGEKSEQGFAARKDSGYLPELDKALSELRADGTLSQISQKYLKADATGAPADTPIRAAGVLRVGTEGTYSPFSYHDPATGQLAGYDVDVARAVGEKLGVPVEFVETPWDSIFAALEANRFDVVANQVTITPERQAKYDLSQPYSVGEGVIVTRADDDSIKSLADLKGKTTAQSITSNWAQVARDAGATVQSVEGFAQAITLLNQGRIDATVNDSIAVYAYLAETGDTSVKIAAQTGERSDQGFAARKNSGLLPELNGALQELHANGTLARISQKYLKADATGAAPEGTQGAPGSQQEPPQVRSAFQLVLDNLWPLAKAALTMTIPLTIISFIIGLVIALGVALARLSSNVVLSNIARFYISIIRGTPLLVQLFIVFYALPEFGVKIDPFPAAVIAFSLNVGGYAAEIIRSAIQSVPKGQWEAAETIGYNYAGALRRIILPQATRVAVPPLSNTLISLVKDTSLASTILVTELLRQAQIVAAPTFEFFALYGTAAIYYWVICLVLSFGQARVERRLERYVAR
ncbi:amine acid ABC transporter, permease protein, 3-TM region, His/Glu/Gln/Arg/opine family [Mycobacterium sp. 88mf]|nr:amine acid ABC transporter, permease protein, 3-TM region, His/Glu/Gln/Arg/opine family [Mycobacterium sp. 88mf]SFF85747.1 amine acid ABC transporter, permease protein, 3-TM region, His/Glu/Gln/Arg/opine family [Mycobacterium sp. 455mf]